MSSSRPGHNFAARGMWRDDELDEITCIVGIHSLAIIHRRDRFSARSRRPLEEFSMTRFAHFSYTSQGLIGC